MARSTIAHRRGPLEERFWHLVNKNPASGCWEWMGNRSTNNNYGTIWGGPHREKSIRAHRLSWELHNGPIPKGLCVCHKCDNPPCVNPDHLFLGTVRDNMQDKINKGRGNDSGLGPFPKGERHPSAKLTDKDVLDIRLSRATGTKYRDIMSRYGISKGTLSLIISRRTWQHI